MDGNDLRAKANEGNEEAGGVGDREANAVVEEGEGDRYVERIKGSKVEALCGRDLVNVHDWGDGGVN